MGEKREKARERKEERENDAGKPQIPRKNTKQVKNRRKNEDKDGSEQERYGSREVPGPRE